MMKSRVMPTPDGGGFGAAARSRTIAQPVADQDVARQDEEQHHRLEDAGGRLRHMHRPICATWPPT